MKKVMMIVLSMILLILPAMQVVAATENIPDNAVCSEASYGEYDLTWDNNGQRDLLMSVAGENGTIYFRYDENGYRTQKINASGEMTEFAYDTIGNLVFVSSEAHSMEYIYNAESELTEIIIDNVTYACVLEGKSVGQLVDNAGNPVVKYEYENSRVSAVYGYNEQGELQDKTDDETFIGNLNKVTFNSYYYDEETGWYYCGRYFDTLAWRFVDGIDVTVEEVLQQIEKSRVINDVFTRGYQMYAELIKSANFGCPINDSSSTWYASTSDVELLARLIYGENPYSDVLSDERCAVAWVLWNRKVKTGYGGDTLRLVATNPGHFAAIGAGENSNNARNPTTSSGAWSNAVAYACLIFCAEIGGYSNPTAELEEAMPRPLGITADHTFFCSYNSAVSKLNAGKSLNSAVIAGYGSVGSDAWMLEGSYIEYIEMLYQETGVDIEADAGLDDYIGKVNIFYTNYPG